jgi:hypothetical protein
MAPIVVAEDAHCLDTAGPPTPQERQQFMSTLTLLPLIRVADGVQFDEDWQLSIAFYLDDGVTPVPLSGLSFSLSVGAFAMLSTNAGQIAVSGPNGNLLVITVLAAEKENWPNGVFPITLTATDGSSTRDLFASSTLAIGSGQVARVSLIIAPDSIPRSIATPIPAALAAALQALQPTELAAALGSLTSSQLGALSQALFGALPTQTDAGAPVPSGQAFVNTSGYVVIAQ